MSAVFRFKKQQKNVIANQGWYLVTTKLLTDRTHTETFTGGKVTDGTGNTVDDFEATKKFTSITGF